MTNAKTRRQCAKVLASTEVLQSQSESQLQKQIKSQIKNSSLRRKRKREGVAEQDDHTTCNKAVQSSLSADYLPRRSGIRGQLSAENSKVRIGGCSARATNQQGKFRTSLLLQEKLKAPRTHGGVEVESAFGKPKKGAKNCSKVKQDAKESVRGSGNEKQAAAEKNNCEHINADKPKSSGISHKRKRRDLLDDSRAVNQHLVGRAASIPRPLTRGMAKAVGHDRVSRVASIRRPLTRRMTKTGLQMETVDVQIKRPNPCKIRGKGEFSKTGREVPPERISTGVAESCSKLGRSIDKVEVCKLVNDDLPADRGASGDASTFENGPRKKMVNDKLPTRLGNPDDASSLEHGSCKELAEDKLPPLHFGSSCDALTTLRTRRHNKRIPEWQASRETRSGLPEPVSPRITRGMKGKCLDSGLGIEDTRGVGELNYQGGVDEKEAARKKLRNQKGVGAAKDVNDSRHLSKGVRRQQSSILREAGIEDPDAKSGMVKNCRDKDTRSRNAVDAVDYSMGAADVRVGEGIVMNFRAEDMEGCGATNGVGSGSRANHDYVTRNEEPVMSDGVSLGREVNLDAQGFCASHEVEDGACEELVPSTKILTRSSKVSRQILTRDCKVTDRVLMRSSKADGCAKCETKANLNRDSSLEQLQSKPMVREMGVLGCNADSSAEFVENVDEARRTDDLLVSRRGEINERVPLEASAVFTFVNDTSALEREPALQLKLPGKDSVEAHKEVKEVTFGLLTVEVPCILKENSTIQVPLSKVVDDHQVECSQKNETKPPRNRVSSKDKLKCQTSSLSIPMTRSLDSLLTVSCTELLKSLHVSIDTVTTSTAVHNINQSCLSPLSFAHDQSHPPMKERNQANSSSDILSQKQLECGHLASGRYCLEACIRTCSLKKTSFDQEFLQQHLQRELAACAQVGSMVPATLPAEAPQELLKSAGLLYEPQKKKAARLVSPDLKLSTSPQLGAGADLTTSNLPEVYLADQSSSLEASKLRPEEEMIESPLSLAEGSRAEEVQDSGMLEMNNTESRPDAFWDPNLEISHVVTNESKLSTGCLYANCLTEPAALPNGTQDMVSESQTVDLRLEGVSADEEKFERKFSLGLEDLHQLGAGGPKTLRPALVEEIAVLSEQLPLNISNMGLDIREEGDAEAVEPMVAEPANTDVPYNKDVTLESSIYAQYPGKVSNDFVRSYVVERGELPLPLQKRDIVVSLGPETQTSPSNTGETDLTYVNLHGGDQVHLQKQEKSRELLLGGVHLTPTAEERTFLPGGNLEQEEALDVQMKGDEQKQECQKCHPLVSEDITVQKSTTDGIKASKRRKGRTGSDLTKESELQLQRRAWGGYEGADRDEDVTSRVYSKKKGFLLVSTSFEPGGMRIRPRPLDPDQPIPTFLEGRDKDLLEYDGGSFYRWLQQQEETRVKKLASEPGEGMNEDGGSGTPLKSGLVKERPIVIPSFRKLQDYEQMPNNLLKGRVYQSELGKQSGLCSPHAYLRYARIATRTVGHALGGSFSTVPSVYDMDEEDDEWLQEYNNSLKSREGPAQGLSENNFEQLIELFEREFMRISQINSKFDAGDQYEKGVASGHRLRKSEVESSQRGGRSRMKGDREKVLNSKDYYEKEVQRSVDLLQRISEECCICNGGENSEDNWVHKCQLCSISVHQSCYGIIEPASTEINQNAPTSKWSCRKCEAVVGGLALPSISCAICCKPGGAMKPTVNPSKWAHVACALYTNETFFVDPEAMEPVDGLLAVETRVKKQRERCGLCGVKEGSCVRCASRGCRAPFHISCGVIQGASFELRHAKQQVVGVRSFCPRHAAFVPAQKWDENQCSQSAKVAAGPTELLPIVSEESSDSLEGLSVRPQCSQLDGKQGYSTKHELNSNRGNSTLRRKRTDRSNGTGVAVQGRVSDGSEKHVLESCLLSLTRSRSLSKGNMRTLSKPSEETDSCLQTVKAVSVETVGSAFHHPLGLGKMGHDGEVIDAANNAGPVAVDAKDETQNGGKSVTHEVDQTTLILDSVEEPDPRESLPRLETLETSLAPAPIVRAVYSYWQSKRVVAKGPILHEFMQLQASRTRGIFNKLLQKSNDLPPALGHDAPARAPTRRPRSFSHNPALSKLLELKQRLEMLHGIARNVVQCEQLEDDIQEPSHQCTQQKLLLARAKSQGGQCYWCKNAQNLLGCSSCPKVFCFHCFKHRRGYGVKGWVAASKLPKYVCNFCLGLEEVRPELDANWVTSTPSAAGLNSMGDRLGDCIREFGILSSKPFQRKSLGEEPHKELAWIGPQGQSKDVSSDDLAGTTMSAVPGKFGQIRCVNRMYSDGIFAASLNGVTHDREVVQHVQQNETGKKVKRRRVTKSFKKKQKVAQNEFLPRTTKRIQKLARSPSFVYDSEEEVTAVSESEESRVEKTVKLSELRDTKGIVQCTNVRQTSLGGVPDKAPRPLRLKIALSAGGGKPS